MQILHSVTVIFCENLGYQKAHSGRMFVPPLENREVYVLRVL